MSMRFGAVFMTMSFRTSRTLTGDASCRTCTRSAAFVIAMTMPLVRPCPATSPNARPSLPAGKRQEVEVVASDLRRGPVGRRERGGAELRVRRRQERGLDAVRGVDLRLDPLALDDALHVRREVLVGVGDRAARREAGGRDGGDPGERQGEREERPRPRRRRTRRRRAAEGRRGGRRRTPRSRRARRSDHAKTRRTTAIPPKPTASARVERARREAADAHEDAEARVRSTPTGEKALAVEEREEEEKADAREKERVERRRQHHLERAGDRIQRLALPGAQLPQTRPARTGAAGTRSAAAATAGAARRPASSEPPTVAFTASRLRTASKDASRSPQRSRARLSPTDQARKTRTDAGCRRRGA